MCKSTEICDETLIVLLKIFFRAHLRGQVFLIVCSIYKRNSRLYSVHRIVYFFQNNFLLFKKISKKALFFDLMSLNNFFFHTHNYINSVSKERKLIISAYKYITIELYMSFNHVSTGVRFHAIYGCAT